MSRSDVELKKERKKQQKPLKTLKTGPVFFMVFECGLGFLLFNTKKERPFGSSFIFSLVLIKKTEKTFEDTENRLCLNKENRENP